MKSIRLSRRALLRGAGGVALGLPWLEAMTGRPAHAEDAAPKRLVIVYTPNGNVPSRYWPSGTESDFTLSGTLEPLKKWKSKLIVNKNVDLLSAQRGPGDAHQKGTGTCLTGVQLQEGDFPGDAGLSAGWGDGISIDQRIADAVGKHTRYPSLEFGVLVSGANIGARISYRGPGRPIPPENSPFIANARIFGVPSADPQAEALQKFRRERVLNRVHGAYQRLSKQLGTEDRQKLEGHMESVSELQTRLGQAAIQFGGVCERPLLDESIDVELRSNMPAIGKLQMDLLAMSLACDATRVASLMWTNSATRQVFSWLGKDITEGHHVLAHKGDEDSKAWDQMFRINTWYSEQFDYLLQKLDAIPEGDGSVLDNTVVLWVNEQMKGNNHDRNGMPYLMAGSLGGHFRTGRYVTHAPGSSSNQLFVSLLHAFGIEENTFGDPTISQGPLSGLT